MNIEKQNNSTIDRYSEAAAGIDLKRLVRVLWSRWYWIVGAIVMALLASFIFLKVSKPRYVASVTLRYNEKKTELDELNKLIQPDGLGGGQEYLTEKYVIESEEVINGAVALLKNPFTFKKKGAFRDDDVYPYQPFTAQILYHDKTEFGNGTFELLQNGVIKYVSKDKSEEKQFDLAKDTLIAVKGFGFKVTSIQNLEDQYVVTYNDLESVKEAVDNKIDVKEPERNLPILELSFTYNNQKFTQDFLNKLLASYEDYNLAQKRKSSDLTIKFIQDQIKLYSNSLKQASSKVADFKQRNAVPSLQSSMTDVMNKMAELETQKSTIEIAHSYINLLEENLSSNRFETINIGNVGLDATSDVVLVRLINDLNAVLLKRKDALIKNFSVNSQQVKALDDEVERIRGQVLSNIKIQKQKNETVLQMVNQNINTLKGRVGSLPEVERQLLYLESDRAVTDKIYSLLLNREIEASIVKAGILPSFNVLTRTDAYKTYPPSFQIILIAFFIGLVVGILLIFGTRYLNDKFVDVNKIGQNEKVNLLGILNRYPEKVANSGEDIIRFLDNRSLFSESINSIRTNLSFLVGHQQSKGKLLVISSEISGEGKSFVTVNLAISLTKTGKKVLIIVSDLRRSKIHRFFDNKNKVGLSTFLAEKNETKEEVINHSTITGLDYITAGPVPFNPTELIQNPRFDQLIEDCQNQYDYVLIDTAPIGLVSDCIPLLLKSDLVLFVIRWLYSSHEAHLFVNQLAEEYDIKNVGVIVNDFYKDDLYASLEPASYYASRGYGYYYKGTYSYYEDETPKSFWQSFSLKKLFSKKSSE